MEFLVEFKINIPAATPESAVKQHQRDEAAASADLARKGNLVRLWRLPVEQGERKVLGLYHADSEGQLDVLLAALPMTRWMQITVTPLEPHPNDPGPAHADGTTFTSSTELADALRHAEVAHGEHEKRIGHADADWPDWYADYMVREHAGEPLPL